MGTELIIKKFKKTYKAKQNWINSIPDNIWYRMNSFERNLLINLQEDLKKRK